LIPKTKFHNDEIEPFVGLEVSIDDARGMVRAVSGGRIIVDFNHPLAGHKLHYDVNILRIITDDKEQVESAMNLMGIPFNSVSVEGKKATIEMQELPEELKQGLVSEITRLTGMDSVEFKAQPLNKPSSDDTSAERGG
jgi:FKBP-type peptidyl-prolyl cis-trans isomerase 2